MDGSDMKAHEFGFTKMIKVVHDSFFQYSQQRQGVIWGPKLSLGVPFRLTGSTRGLRGTLRSRAVNRKRGVNEASDWAHPHKLGEPPASRGNTAWHVRAYIRAAPHRLCPPVRPACATQTAFTPMEFTPGHRTRFFLSGPRHALAVMTSVAAPSCR